jgi:hypothetical protein
MKRLLAALTLIATIAQAQLAPPLIHEIATDFQQLQELQDMGLQQGANVEYRVRLRVAGRWFPLAGLTAEWQARENVTDQDALVAVSVATVTNETPNYFRIQLNATQTGSAVQNWTYSVIVKDGVSVYPLGEGRLDIQASAWSGTPSVLLAGKINWAQVPSYTNTLTHGPNRPDGVTITSVENEDGSLTWSALGSAADLFTDDTLHGEGTPLDPLGVASNIVAGAELGATALQSGDNVSELVNDAGYVTGTPWTSEGYLTSESDTLQSVTARGATTTNIITVADVVAGTASLTNAAALASGAAQLSAATNLFTGAAIYDGQTVDVAITGTPGLTNQNIRLFSGAGTYLSIGAQGLLVPNEVLGGEMIATVLPGPNELRPSVLGGGVWKSLGTATNSTQIVNFQTLTNNLASYVPTTRTISINGDVQTLSSNLVFEVAGIDTNAVEALILESTRTPHLIPWASTIEIASTNGISQHIQSLDGTTTINWPAGAVDTETVMSVTMPPTGAQMVELSTNNVTYSFAAPLVDGPSTNHVTRMYYSSPVGVTNGFVVVRQEAGFATGSCVESINGQSGVVVLTAEDVGAVATSERVYQPITQLTPTATNIVVAVDPTQPIYRVLLPTNDMVTLDFDLSGLSLASNVATWEVWVQQQTTNTSLGLPVETNGVYYVAGDGAHTFASTNEVLYTVWRSWIYGGVTNLWCNQWEAR